MPLLALLFDQARQLALARDADVEVAVGREDDAVDAALDEVLGWRCRRRAGCRRRRWSSRRLRARRSPAGSRPCGRRASTAARGRSRRRRRRSRRGRAASSVSTSIRIAVLTSGSLSGGPSSRRRRAGTRGCAAACVSAAMRRRLQPDQREPMLRVPRAGGHLGRHRERRAFRRVRVREAEVVDQLLDAHRVGGWQRAVVEEAADVRVRRGVDVDRERRERIVARRDESGSRRSCRRPRC